MHSDSASTYATFSGSQQAYMQVWTLFGWKKKEKQRKKNDFKAEFFLINI